MRKSTQRYSEHLDGEEVELLLRNVDRDGPAAWGCMVTRDLCERRLSTARMLLTRMQGNELNRKRRERVEAWQKELRPTVTKGVLRLVK